MKLLLPLSILATAVSGAEDCYVCGSADIAMGTLDSYVVGGGFNYSCAEIQEEITNSSLSCLGVTIYYKNLLKTEIDAACGCPGADTSNGGSGSSGSGNDSSTAYGTSLVLAAGAALFLGSAMGV